MEGGGRWILGKILKDAIIEGGLVLWRSGSPQAEADSGWRIGDYFLYLRDLGSSEANWEQNMRALLDAMKNRKPIYDSFVNPRTGLQFDAPLDSFLYRERMLLEKNGWTYNPSRGAYLPPL